MVFIIIALIAFFFTKKVSIPADSMITSDQVVTIANMHGSVLVFNGWNAGIGKVHYITKYDLAVSAADTILVEGETRIFPVKVLDLKDFFVNLLMFGCAFLLFSYCTDNI